MSDLSVSVIIATYNRKVFLRKVLLSLNRQTHSNFDVIVASDGSSDGTKEMVDNLSSNLKYKIVFIEHEDMGFRKSLILNKAIVKSNADYLIFIDDDCVLPDFFINNHVKKANITKVVLGKYFSVPSGRRFLFEDVNIVNGKYQSSISLFDWLDMFYWKIKYKIYFFQKHPTRPKLVGGNFSVFRDAMLNINGFDCDFIGWGYEDDDVRNRLIRSGLSLDEVVLNGYNFNLGDERNRTPRQINHSKILAHKEMAYSLKRPWRCINGINTGL